MRAPAAAPRRFCCVPPTALEAKLAAAPLLQRRQRQRAAHRERHSLRCLSGLQLGFEITYRVIGHGYLIVIGILRERDKEERGVKEEKEEKEVRE